MDQDDNMSEEWHTSLDSRSILVTCEHGGNRIPPGYRHLFANSRELLQTHRGFDPGALIMAKALASHFRASLLTATISRLLVDLNRTVGHRNLHMEAIRMLSASSRQMIVERYHQPYWEEAERLVLQRIDHCGGAIHISCHSFTNILNGMTREADIGLLYDPARQGEVALCADWKSELKVSAPERRVRRNFPYEGRGNGLTSALRKKYSPDEYVGVELEINQKNVLPLSRQWSGLRESIINSLQSVLRGHCA